MFELARIQKERDKAQLGSRLTRYRWLASTAARSLLLMTLIGAVSVSGSVYAQDSTTSEPEVAVEL